mmetsp:Transcript_65215/g.102730  ORF Transcript_65215/g.102730 Transcript_65215/m.102730 type:complete len:90 (-) Transcript_65215:20-289(-)
MCRKPMGWTNALRCKKVNIWDPARQRVDKYLCSQPYQEVKFTRPTWLTRFGFPSKPRSSPEDLALRKGDAKYCDMSKLHKQEAKRPFHK